MYSATLSLTSSLDGVGGQRHAPAALPPGKTRYPLYRRLGGPQGGKAAGVYYYYYYHHHHHYHLLYAGYLYSYT